MFSGKWVLIYILFPIIYYLNCFLVVLNEKSTVHNLDILLGVSNSSSIVPVNHGFRNSINTGNIHRTIDYATDLTPLTKPLLCIASTIVDKTKKSKVIAQRNAMISLNLIPSTKAMFFTNSSIWLSYCKRNGYECSNEFKSNKYGTPFFKSMIHQIQNTHDCTFYGYVNGDILFHSNLTSVLFDLKTLIDKHELKERTLITGRRTNIFNYAIQSIRKDLHYNDGILVTQAKNGTLFREDALDYFIFTPTTFNWTSVYDVVIGRPLYDNYLLHLISSDDHADLVDVTSSGSHTLHQTDEDGVFAGHRKRPDLNWNRERIGKEYTMGNTNYADYRLDPVIGLIQSKKNKDPFSIL